MKIVIGRQYDYSNKPPEVKNIDLIGIIRSFKSYEDARDKVVKMTFYWLRKSHNLDKAPFFKPSDCGVITIDNITTVENKNFISPVAIEYYNSSIYFVSTINIDDIITNDYTRHRLSSGMTDREDFFKWDIVAISSLYDLFKKVKEGK